MNNSISGIGVLDKAIKILEVLEVKPCSLSDLVERTNFSRPTAHRIAMGLEAHGFVGRDPNGKFILGKRLLEIASSPITDNLISISRPVLAKLRDKTGESIQLYVKRKDSRICILSLESRHGLRTIVEVGQSLPLDKGSGGKVFLVTDPKLSYRWIQSSEERERGVSSVSAGIYRNVSGSQIVFASVSLSGPIDRIGISPGQIHGPEVVAAAREIEVKLGWVPME